jgi:fibro-slime domain-containing protein
MICSAIMGVVGRIACVSCSTTHQGGLGWLTFITLALAVACGGSSKRYDDDDNGGGGRDANAGRGNGASSGTGGALGQGTGGSDGGGTTTGGTQGENADSGGAAGVSGNVSVCGDGIISGGEACDDANTYSADGCSSKCVIELSWSCTGEPSTCRRGCGDGRRSAGEECDDGNTEGGDGCNAECRLEGDATCDGPGTPCIVPGAQCGDGLLAAGEECDDGNRKSADGCSKACKLEAGYRCRVAGGSCAPVCGDGLVLGTEACDDGGTVDGDGCSAVCVIEPGASCTGSPSRCTHSLCGNGQVEAGEACDEGDSNGFFFGDGTGCSANCTVEPKCRDDSGVTRACETYCGDGNEDAGEECDDGNGLDHDGCSHDCAIEPGFTCTDMEKPNTLPCPSNPALECVILPMIYRDFDPSTNPDFFFLGKNSVTCVPDASGTPTTIADGAACPATDQAGPCPGLASATLDKDGTPAAGTNSMCRCILTDHDNTGIILTAPSCSREDGSTRHHLDTMVQGISDIKKWYAGAGLRGMLELAQHGTQYQFSSSVMGAPAGAAGTTIEDDIHASCLGTPRPLESGFFPFDATSSGSGAGTKYCNLWPYWSLGTSAASCATGASLTIKSQWDPMAAWDACPMTGTGGFVPKSDGTGTPLQGQLHDFYYTSVARYLFRYSGVSSSLSFAGNDDVWVYLNGKLKLDLGATHERVTGTTVLGDSTDGLEVGKIYEVAVFQANRQPRGADYQLTLSSASTVQSNCMPTCGDGVTTAGEQCDDGDANDGHYGGCTADCMLAGFCGDGVRQPSVEHCDDGQNDAGYGEYGCAPGCRFAPTCGDGVIDAAFGEACDHGIDNGDGVCTKDCTFG